MFTKPGYNFHISKYRNSKSMCFNGKVAFPLSTSKLPITPHPYANLIGRVGGLSHQNMLYMSSGNTYNMQRTRANGHVFIGYTKAQPQYTVSY